MDGKRNGVQLSFEGVEITGARKWVWIIVFATASSMLGWSIIEALTFMVKRVTG